ncbi:hypothetical protein ES703_110859 [subsurface metagenome]
MQINVSINLNLGPRLVRVGDKVLGACVGVTIAVTEATPEELIKLKNADVIELVKPHRAELEET